MSLDSQGRVAIKTLWVCLFVGLFLILFSVLTTGRAQSSISLVKQFPDATYLITIDGQEHWAVNLAKTKELKQAETDAKSYKAQLDLCGANVQDERVKYGKLETLYGEQSTLFKSCMQLSGNGPKWSRNWLLDLGLKIAPTVTSVVRCN